jgi:hypothetical protein
MPSLRIAGLVALMRQVRSELAAGLLPAELPTFRQRITAALEQVEQLARRQHRRPAQLPAPSYRAYQFLKSLDLENLPLRSAQAPSPALPPVRVRNLVAIAAGLNEQLAALTRAGALPLARETRVSAVLAQAQQQAAAVEALCAARGSLPAGLPMQSRRAYQWLKYLSDPDQLHDTLTALALAHQVLARARWPWRPALAGGPARLEFYPTAYLYRMRPEQGVARVAIAPGYVAAPAPVLEALLRVALGYGRQAARDTLHAYAARPEFAEATMALELATEPPPGSLRGRHYDLDQVFERVNHGYFGGRLARPRLVWSRTITGRLLGYYQRSTDRLMLSLALDDVRVPPSAIDLVMYHELLHKHLGVQVVNGRHYVHTEAFRRLERQSREYAEAKAFLGAST